MAPERSCGPNPSRRRCLEPPGPERRVGSRYRLRPIAGTTPVNDVGKGLNAEGPPPAMAVTRLSHIHGQTRVHKHPVSDDRRVETELVRPRQVPTG